MAKHLVIGLGEVGTSLMNVLKDGGLSVNGVDKEGEESWPDYDLVHICFPFSDKFEENVNYYRKAWLKDDGVLVIHSTVPVGTTRKLKAVHSPIHGIHPNLESGIKTFVKYIGGEEYEQCEKLLCEYNKAGIKGLIVENPETSELSKLGCTTRHGLMIIEQKEFKRRCEEVGANFDQAYTSWNGFYSDGYEQLGYPYLKRSRVKPMDGPIGGHCIIPNCDFIGGPIAEFVKERNKTF